MNSFLTFRYYFDPYPNLDFQYSTLTLVVSLLVLILGIALLIYRKKLQKSPHKKWTRDYGKRLINLGIWALALLFFREMGMPYFSMRIWWLVWLILLLGFSLSATRQGRKAKAKPLVIVPQALDAREKYLPKKKKRK